MTVPAGGEIGEVRDISRWKAWVATVNGNRQETHTVDQHLYFVSGNAQAITDGKASIINSWLQA